MAQERTITHPEDRYANALKWIFHVAGLHYFGGAFDPEHMRRIANIAAEALNLQDGKDLPDYDTTMKGVQEKAREWADRIGQELLQDTEEG